MRRILSFLSGVLVLSGTSADAQIVNSAAAYFALIVSPAGAVPPILSSAMLNRAMTQPDFSLRYGHTSFDGASSNVLDARVGFAAGTKATIGVNAGYQSYTCDGCEGHFIAGANAEGRLLSYTLGTGPEAGQLTVGLNGEAGFGTRSGTTVTGVTAGLPFALVTGSPTLKIAPFLTPALGWGGIFGSGESQTGTRFLRGAGVAIVSPTSGIDVNAGFQKVFIDGRDTIVGVSLTFGIR